MISYSDAKDIIYKTANENLPETEIASIINCVGRVLAEDLFAKEYVPAFDNSAMDGFAVKTQWFENGSTFPMRWKVAGLIAAGDDSTKMGSHLDCALEIMTGAEVPCDYDAVIKIEDVKIIKNEHNESAEILVQETPKKYLNIRRQGEDFQIGQLVLKKGNHIKIEHLLALSALGITEMKVFKVPRIGIISTGKELVTPEKKTLAPGEIRNSTQLFLDKYLNQKGFPINVSLDHPDNAIEFEQALELLLSGGVDIVLSTGAVSMGKYDFVMKSLKEMGATIHFHKCAIRPGKPILFASFKYQGKHKYLFGLPGNPISTVVGLNFFVMPFLNKLLKMDTTVVNKLPLLEDVKKPEGLRCFYKAKTLFQDELNYVESLPGQASFMVQPLINANAWIVLPEEGQLLKKGTNVEVYGL